MLYLLHFDRPLAHAGHYLGFTRNLERRLERHRRGRGARIVRALKVAGIAWRLARTWPDGDQTLERKLKNRNNGPRLCPVCRPEFFLPDGRHKSLTSAKQ